MLWEENGIRPRIPGGGVSGVSGVVDLLAIDHWIFARWMTSKSELESEPCNKGFTATIKYYRPKWQFKCLNMFTYAVL